MQIEIKSGDEKKKKQAEVKRAMEILKEAEELKQDVELMGLVQKALRKEQKAITKIQDIKDRYVEITLRAPEEDIMNDDGEISVKRAKSDEDDGSDE